MITRFKDKLWYWALKKLLGKQSVVYGAYVQDGVVFAHYYINCYFNGSVDPRLIWPPILEADGPFVPMLPLL